MDIQIFFRRRINTILKERAPTFLARVVPKRTALSLRFGRIFYRSAKAGDLQHI
jgi:hypothetical protein